MSCNIASGAVDSFLAKHLQSSNLLKEYSKYFF